MAVDVVGFRETAIHETAVHEVNPGIGIGRIGISKEKQW
jgi:hypothetical protein